VILSQDAIELLADRIERAYRRRHPRWHSVGLTPGVWGSAAARLSEITAGFRDYPVDPELFVAAQLDGGTRRDPWAELTQQRSLRRYVVAVRKIVGQLREELKDEVRRAERRLIRGTSLEDLLDADGARISPLTRYILARRAGRDDLSSRHREAAEGQHRACPLYRLAALSVLPGEAYPTPEADGSYTPGGHASLAFSMN